MKTRLVALLAGLAMVLGADVLSNAGTIPTNGLVAYYPFNGNADDESGNGNHLGFPGVPRNATFTTDRFGSPNSTLDFDGTDDYLVHSGSESVFDFTTAETFSAWINLDNVNQGWVLVKAAYGDFGTFGIGMNNGRVNLRVYTADSVMHNLESTLPPLEAETWTHVAGVYDGTGVTPGLSLYINGALDGFLPFSGSLYNNSSQLYVGAQPTNPGAHVNGRIDDIAIYDRALSATEVQQLSAVPEPSSLSLLTLGTLSLVGYGWRRKRKMAV